MKEGSWVFYRLAEQGEGARIAGSLLGLLRDCNGEAGRDAERLRRVREERTAAAAAYFRDNAEAWDRIRGLHVDENEVEKAMLAAAGEGGGEACPTGLLVDLGTGTGRMLELFSDRIERGIGIDTSHQMLNLARSKLHNKGVSNCQVRHGDIYDIPLPGGCADLLTLHQVLHFLDDPAAALEEAGRLLKAGGKLLIVDFAPHELEFLRDQYAHRRLGFSDREIRRYCKGAGLRPVSTNHLEPAGGGGGNSLTVTLWTARK